MTITNSQARENGVVSGPDNLVVGVLLAGEGRARVLRAGEVLFRENDRSSSIHGCLAGRLKLVRTVTAGREVLLDLVLPGEVFGEVAAIDGAPRGFTAVAMVETTICSMPGHRFRAALAEHPALALASLRSFARRLRSADDRICEAGTEPVAGRLACLLADLCMRVGSPGSSGIVVDAGITQQLLADWLGVSREATARALADLRRAGIVETGRARITVREPAALRAFGGHGVR
jgi:CRP-like cAMP-binding protein